MLRRIIIVPEGVYYRGRFRATAVWSKVSMRESESSLSVFGEEGPHATDEPGRVLRERPVSGKNNASALQVKSAGS